MEEEEIKLSERFSCASFDYTTKVYQIAARELAIRQEIVLANFFSNTAQGSVGDTKKRCKILQRYLLHEVGDLQEFFVPFFGGFGVQCMCTLHQNGECFFGKFSSELTINGKFLVKTFQVLLTDLIQDTIF